MIDVDLAWLSAAVYLHLSAFERAVVMRDYIVIETFSHHGTEAALVSNTKSAAIVFRGTEACNLRFRDIWSNATLPWPTVWQGAGRVHSGYRRHLNLVGFKALSYAEQVAEETPLYVTGHSLGGAIGTLFASWYYHDNRRRKTNYKLAGLITFGAPKAVDSAAATSILCPIRRYVVRGDWAPHWPPLLGFGHPTRQITLDPAPRFHGLLERHNINGYVEALKIKRD